MSLRNEKEGTEGTGLKQGDEGKWHGMKLGVTEADLCTAS